MLIFQQCLISQNMEEEDGRPRCPFYKAKQFMTVINQRCLLVDEF